MTIVTDGSYFASYNIKISKFFMTKSSVHKPQVLKPHIKSLYVRHIRKLSPVVLDLDNLTLKINSELDNRSSNKEIEKLKIPITINDLELKVIKEISYINDIENQDILSIINELKDISKLAEWDADKSNRVLDIILSTNIKSEIQHHKTFESKIKALLEIKYPKRMTLKYITDLKEIRQIDFRKIREYMKCLETTINNYACPLNWTKG